MNSGTQLSITPLGVIPSGPASQPSLEDEHHDAVRGRH